MKDLKLIQERLQLNEGRKQARKILKQYSDSKIEDFFKEFEKMDTTKNGKYFELLATAFRKYPQEVTLKYNIDGIKKLLTIIENKKIVVNLKDINFPIDLMMALEDLIEAKETKKNLKPVYNLSGLKEGSDYFKIYEDKDIISFIPTSYESSVKIVGASGKNHWCVANINNDTYWSDYIIRDEKRIPYVYSKTGESWVKMAIEIFPNGKLIFWDKIDDNFSEEDFNAKEFFDYDFNYRAVIKGFEKIRKDYDIKLEEKKPKYDKVFNFQKNGLAKVKANNKWGLINRDYEEVLEPKYDWIGDFLNGIAEVKLGTNSNIKYGFINEKGIEVLKPKYDVIYAFKDGFAKVELDDRYGFINEKLEEVLEPKYQNIYDSKYGLQKVHADGKWGIINKYYEEIVALKYDLILNYENGFAGVELDYTWGFINSKGEEIVKPKYDNVYSFQKNGLATIDLGGRKGYVDTIGNVTWDEEN